MAKTEATIKVSLIDGVSKGLNNIQKSVNIVGLSLSKITPIALGVATAIAAMATAGLGALATEGVKDAATFEAALDRISAKSGVTGAALDELGVQIRDVSKDAGKTADEGAAAFLKLTEEGLSAAEAIKALPTALDFATGAVQKADEAVGGLADTMAVFNLGSGNFERTADVIAAGALKAGTGIGDLQKQLVQIGPTAVDVKLDLEGTAAALGVLAQNGIEGGRGAKSLLQILDQIRDPASKFREELRKIGIDSGDFQVVLAELAKAGPRAEAAFLALGVNGTASLKALAKDGGAAVKEIADGLQNVEGTTSRTAQIIRDNLGAAWTEALNAFDDARAQFLTPILEPLKVELQALAEQISAFVKTEEFASLRDDFKAAFVEGLEALKLFIKEFDFKVAFKEVQTFVRDSNKLFSELKTNVTTIADAVKLVAGTINLTVRPLHVARDLVNQYAEATRDAGDAAAEAEPKVTKLREATQKKNQEQEKEVEVDRALEERRAAYIAGLKGMRDAVVETQPVIVELTEAQREQSATNEQVQISQQKLTEGTGETTAALEALKNKQQEYNAELGKGATLTEDEQKAITKRTAAFADTQKEIQNDIDARKRQAGAVRDVGAAGDEAAESMDEFNESVAADAGYSSAAFAALGARLDAIAPKIARLAGVSEESIRQGVNRDTLGATNAFLGMNTAMERLEERFKVMGGDAALAKIEAAAKRAADAVAGIGEAAAGARADLASMVDELQEEAAARDGDAAAAEDRRYREQLAQIAEKERLSGGTERTQADLARALAKRNHEARLAEIRAEARSRVDAELGADREIDNTRNGGGGRQGATGQLGGPISSPGSPLQPTREQQVINYHLTVNASAVTGDVAMDAAARSMLKAIKRIQRDRL